MNCPIQSGGNEGYLLDYVAGKLDAAAQAQMAEHIESCPACREFAGGQQSVWNALDDFELAAISLDFDRRLFERIEQEPVSWWTRFTRSLSPVSRHVVPIGATAAVLLVAGFMLNRPSSAPAPLPKTAQVEAIQPDQLQSALDDMEMLRDFNRLIKPDVADPKM